jgi:lysophospholipase L1-like esterase
VTRIVRRAAVVVLLVGLAVAAAEVGVRIAGDARIDVVRGTALELPTAEIVLLCLGESSTTGLWVRPEDSYPKQLERALNAALGSRRVRAVVPPDLGQNSGQLANRIGGYLAFYRPRLVLLMAGHNDEWSFGESRVFRFLPLVEPGPWFRHVLRARLQVVADDVRLFRFLRGLSMQRTGRWEGALATQNSPYRWGGPEFTPYPPDPWRLAFAAAHRPAFLEAWRSSVRTVVHEARRAGTGVLLLTYPVSPAHLPAEEWVRLAGEEKVPLARPDARFAAYAADGVVDRYLFHERWHPNERGYAAVAATVLAALEAQDLLALGAGTRWQAAAAALDPARYSALPGSRPVGFGSTAADRFLGAGWSRPEDGLRWTEGARAEIVFAPRGLREPVLELTVRPFVAPPVLSRQRVEVSLNGEPVASWQLDRPQVLSLPLPGAAVGRENVLRLELPDAAAPALVTRSTDSRELAVAIESMRLVERR